LALDNKKYTVSSSAVIKFEILGEISDIETIATGRGVYIRRYLERMCGKGRWRK